MAYDANGYRAPTRIKLVVRGEQSTLMRECKHALVRVSNEITQSILAGTLSRISLIKSGIAGNEER